jgi:uncharacterized protein YecE (DUF72 family)
MSGKPDHLLRLGTSSFTAEGWEHGFYPKGMQPRDYLSYYATQFNTLEIDATFYRIPAVSTVKGWHAKTPADFLFALKTPQDITHERVMIDTDSLMNEFLRATEPLGEKLGVILLQFPYFNKKAFAAPAEFLARLKTFLEKLPAALRPAAQARHCTGPDRSPLAAAPARMVRERRRSHHRFHIYPLAGRSQGD